LSKKRNTPAGFKCLTYSRLEARLKPPAAPAGAGLSEFHLPRFADPASRHSGKTGISSHPSRVSSRFKGLSFPVSVPETPESTAEKPLSPAQTKNEATEERLRLEKERETILAKARMEAETILESARVEAEEIRNEARNEARREGLKEAEDEISRRLEELDRLLVRLTTVWEFCRREHEKEMVRLAINCARKLINRELSLDETVILDCINEVFNESSVQGDVTLRLNPEDITLVEKRRAQLLADFPRIRELDLVVGEGIEKGGCILESSLGRIDAGQHSKFEELKRLLDIAS
jgi:flagellar assembly protein FliH